jgi:hypothetical protein
VIKTSANICKPFSLHRLCGSPTVRTKTQDGGSGWAGGREIRVFLQHSQTVLLAFADETLREKKRTERKRETNERRDKT